MNYLTLRRGVLVSRSIARAELAMISGLAQIVRRLSGSAPLRYLTAAEVERIFGQIAYRYRELANASRVGRA